MPEACTSLRWISEAAEHFPAEGGALPFGRRLKEARGHRIPVTVVTGFLGAGKSTLVKRLLDSEAGRGSAVIVNEIGEIGIDDALLQTSGEAVRLLANGCLCCAVRSDLELTLQQMHADRSAGSLPQFRRVVVETSGAADPSAILQTLVGNRSLAGTYHLAGIVTVVDAVHGARTLEEMPEARMQLALADRIVVSKADLAGAEKLAAIEVLLDAANPAAPRMLAAHGAVDPAFLLAEAPPRATAMLAAPAHGGRALQSFSLVFERPFTSEGLREALSVLTRLRGEDLLRVKGLVAVQGCRGPVVVHAVRHQVHPPVELERWPDEDRRSRLVFVGRHVPQDAVRRLFESVAELEDISPRELP
jgi:G3E family GTPase